MNQHHYAINQTLRKTSLSRSDCFPKKSSVKLFATPTNSGNETRKFILKRNKFEPTVIGGTNMLEGDFLNAKLIKSVYY